MGKAINLLQRNNMKLKTKFTLLVAGCTLALLGSYYFLNVRSANNVFVEFNQRSIVQMNMVLLETEEVEAHFTKFKDVKHIQTQFDSLVSAFPEQLFILIENGKVVRPKVELTGVVIEYSPLDTGHQFKIYRSSQSPVLAQYGEVQYSLTNDEQNYLLFWLPKNTLDRKQQESLLMSRLADEFMLTLAVLSLFAAVLSWFGAWYFLQPLKQLKRSFKELEQGNLNTRIEIKHEDEVAEILTSFNRLAAWLQGLHQQYRQMNSDLSHELRTPLNAIRSRIEGMEDGIVAMDKEQLSILATDVESINQLIEDLSLLSLTESKQLVLQNSDVDITQLITDLITRYQLQALKLGVTLESEISPNVVFNTDGKRLRQVLVNLIDNAFKYGADGQYIAVSLAEEEEYIDIKVSDKGKGLTQYQVENIFERFYRSQSSRNDNNSQGLGLAICKQLTALMGANITVASEENQGATFKLRFLKRS